MFLISDKLEKLDPKYNLMKDDKRDSMKEEKRDLMKEEHVELIVAPKQFQKCHIFYTVVIGVVFLTFAWMMMSPKYNKYQLSKIEEQTLQVTEHVINDAQLLLGQIRERAATMSEQNKRAAADYVAGVRDALRERTNVGVQQANQIVLGKIRDIENELTSFELVIDDAVGAFVEDAAFDIDGVRANVTRAESGDAARVLDAAIRQVEREMAAMLVDVDQMYSFYGRYIGHVVERFMQNATDRISVMLNAQRRYCDCTVVDRINMCYNISAQNGEISKSVESAVRLVGIVRNSTETVAALERVYADVDANAAATFDESKLALRKTMDAGQRTLDALLDDEYCYLGSTVRKYAYADHATLKEFMVRSMKTVIESLARSLGTTMADFRVVKPKHHRNTLVVAVEEKLETLVNDMRAKASLIADGETRAEYAKRVNLDDVKELMKTKFENVTRVVNTLFDDQRKRLADDLKYNLGYIVGQQLPYISTLTIQNYIPSDVCPLSVDYQKFLSVTLRDAMGKDDTQMLGDLFESANYYGDDTETGAALAASDMYGSPLQPETAAEAAVAGDGIVTVDDGVGSNGNADENGGVSSTLMGLISSIISSINDAGYTVNEPVRIVVTNDE